MKFNKQNKKWIIGLSAFALASCFGFACGTTLSASADNEPVTPTATPATAEDFYMQGISIRYNQADGEDGIRFGTAMKKTWYDGIVDTNEGKEVTTGTVIVPTALLSAETFEGIMQAVQANDATNTQTTEILESPNSIFTEGGEKYYQTKVYMHSVPQANYNTELTAVAYVAIDGDVAYYTATPCQHSVASAAKYLIENGDLNADLQDYLLNYTVTYYDTDGTTVIATETVKYGEVPTYAKPTEALANPEQIFEKWVTEKDGETEATGAITGSTSVYAGIVDPETTYKVTYKNYDGSVLAVEDELVGQYAQYNGATPTQNGDMYTSYFFTGFGETERVTGPAEYTAQYATYINMDNYYYCVNEKFVLPTQKNTAIDQYGLSYEFNGVEIEAGEEVEIATPGKYTYTIAVGELGSISKEVEVMSVADYEKNFLKTNTNQFYANAGATGGRIVYNGNNQLGIMNDGSYKYTATLADTWNDRITLGSMVGGSTAQWNLYDYHNLSFGIKLEEGTVLTNPTYAIEKNIQNNAGVLWGMQFVDAQGNFVTKDKLQAGVWYTAVLDLSMVTDAETNSLTLYTFNAETGSVYLKDFQFDGLENPGKYSRVLLTNLGETRYMNYSTEVIDNVQTAYKYQKTDTNSVYGLHANAQISASASAKYNAITFRMYVVSSSYGTTGCAFTLAMSSGNAKIAVYDEATGENVKTTGMEHGKWYTVVAGTTENPSSLSSAGWYIYADGNKGQLTAYFTQFRYTTFTQYFQYVSITPTTKYLNGEVVQTYTPAGNGYNYRIGMTKATLDTFLDAKAKNTAEKTYALKIDVTFLSGSDNNFQFWYYNSEGGMKDVTFTKAVTNGWMKMLDAQGNEVTTWENNVKYTLVIYTTMDLGKNSGSTEFGLQIAMSSSARTIEFRNLRVE